MRMGLGLGLTAAQSSGGGGAGLASFTVAIGAGTVGSDLTDFVTPIHLSEMPSGFWSGVRSDGGNLRAYQADGTTLIPHDMAFIDTDVQRGLFFVKHTIAAASDTEIVLKLLDISNAALSASDTNGRNAVWSEYEVAVVFPSSINRVDGSSCTVGNTPLVQDWIETKYLSLASSQGVTFDGTNYYAVSTTSLRRYSSSGGSPTHTNATPLSSMITATGDSTLDHCGAPCIVDGELWVPIQQYPASPYNSQYIGRFALSNLAYIGYIQLTGATRESSGIHYDADLGRLYVTDYTVDTNIPYFDKTTGAYAGQLTLSSNIDVMQGMTEMNGKYYVNSGNANGVYEVEKDGTVNGVVIKSTYGGDEECVQAYGDDLILSQSTGNISHYTKVDDLRGWARIHNSPVGYQRSRSTIWTMAVSWYGTPNVPQQGIIGVRSISSASDRHSGMYDAPTTNGFGLWNTTDSWLYTSPHTFPTAYNKYRAAFAQNDTSARKLSVNGVKNSAGSSSARPTTSADVRYEIAGAAEADDGAGYYQFAWVRHEYMSDDWIDADYESFTSPATFYSITEL